jgi:CheY-like chemotaxis protein
MAKLLLADDSVTVQRVIELTFADEGMQVVSVSDGARAIERVEQERPDVVLADVSMPERNGYEVAEYIKNQPHLAHIPVVLMTGAFEQVDEARARAAGCDAVLAKPFEPQMVISLVNQLLRGEGAGLPAAADISHDAAVPPAFVARRPEAAVSLDAYLEQLDEALSAAPPGPGRAGGEGGAARMVESPPATAGRAEPGAATPAPSPIDSFSALLAEELDDFSLPPSWGALAGRGTPSAAHPAAAASPGTAALTDAQMDDLARRIAERLSDAVIREVVEQRVLEIAERLVREEIERIKAATR